MNQKFKRHKITTSGEFGYYMLYAIGPPDENCLNHVKAAHAGNDWTRVPQLPGVYILKCHYTVCTDFLARLESLLQERGFFALMERDRV